jgi:lipoprotein-anchoring transpeptidase ErfK/SrfK
MTIRNFTAALLFAALSTAIVVPQATLAATSEEEQLLLLKKKKKARLEAQKKAEAARKAEEARKLKAKKLALAKKVKVREQTAASGRTCTGFVQCLFGTKRGVRVNRDARVQTASFAGTTSVFAKKTRKTVSWSETKYKPGSLVVRTPERALYYILPDGKAIRYAVGVGREGFQWSGNSKIVSKQEWPSWTPPKVMIEREAAKGHIIPPFMEGGPGNPLGARAMYIGGTIFRVHGTNNEASIGGAVSSGCIRMMNADVIDLYERVKIGAPIYVYQ